MAYRSRYLDKASRYIRSCIVTFAFSITVLRVSYPVWMIQADLNYDVNLPFDLVRRKHAYASVSVLSIAFAPVCPGSIYG